MVFYKEIKFKKLILLINNTNGDSIITKYWKLNTKKLELYICL